MFTITRMGRHRDSVLWPYRPRRRSRVPRRSPLLLALFVAALMCAGVAAPSLAQARVNPQPQAVSWLSGFGNSDCDKTLDVPGTSAKTIGAIVIINGLDQAGLEAAENLAGLNKAYQVIQCWNYLNSQSHHDPWNPPVQEGTWCHWQNTDWSGHIKNGQCVRDQPAAPQPPKNSPPDQQKQPSNSNNSDNSCPNGMIRVSPETDTTSGCLLPNRKQREPQKQEHPYKQGHDNPQNEGHRNGQRQDHPQRQGHQQQDNRPGAS